MNMGEMPEIDRVWIDTHYEELVSLQVELDADPLAFGPKRLNGKIAHARTMLARCERVFLQVSQYLQHFKRDFRMAEIELKVLKDDLFVNDVGVKAGRTHQERDAFASSKLEKQVKRLHYLELAVADLDAVLEVVKAKRADLRDTQARLRDQVKLCQEEIGLGSKWGVRPFQETDLVPGQGQKALQEFEALIETIEKEEEIHLPSLMDSEEDSEEEEEEPSLPEVSFSPVPDQKDLVIEEESISLEEVEETTKVEEAKEEEENPIPTHPDADIEAFFTSPDPVLGVSPTSKAHEPAEVDIDALFSLL
jgi:hypothetical protein